MGNSIIWYNNIIENSTLVATAATASGYDINNIKDWRSYTWWVANTTTDPQYINIDYGSSVAVNSFAMRGHNFNTAGITVSVEHADDSAYTTNLTAVTFLEESATTFAPTTNYAFGKTFNSATKRYWRIKMTGQSVAPQIAVALLGTRLDFPKRPMGDFSPRIIESQSNSQFSKAGHLLGSIVDHKTIEINPIFRNLTYTFVNGTFKTFWLNHASELKPFFWAVDLDQFPNDVYFVKMKNNQNYQAPIQIYGDVKSLSFGMEGIAEE